MTRHPSGYPAVALVIVTVGLLAAAPASAAPAPLLVVDCGQRISVAVGRQVTLARVAVTDLVTEAAASTPGISQATATGAGTSFTLGRAIALGPATEIGVPADVIADAVIAQVRTLTELEPHTDAVLVRVRDLVTARCGLLRPGVPGPVPAPPVEETPAQAPLPVGRPVGGVTPRAEVALYGISPARHVDIPVATAPQAKYGTVPGYSPRIGADTGPGAGIDAGKADALPARPGDGLGLAAMLAVLALSVACAALVRSWALRRG